MKIPMKNKGKGSERTVTVPCKKCTECASMKIRHWTGRILAELQDGGTPWFCTFTYRGGYDDPKAYWLDYDDIQKTFKILRKAGYKFRYVIVGEYGSERDRAHWHAIMIWDGDPPAALFSTQGYDWPYWKHGTSYIETPRNMQACASYMLKYLLKDPTARMRYSRRPAIGERYLHRYASDLAKAGLAIFPKKATFTVPDNKNKDNRLFEYYIDRTSDLYARIMDTYLETWASERPNDPLPLNKNVIEYIEDLLQGPVIQNAALDEYLQAKYDAQTPQEPNEFTVHTLGNGFIAIVGRTWTVVEKRRKDQVLWQKGVPKSPSDHRLLSPELRQKLIEEVSKAPEYCRKVFALDKQSETTKQPPQNQHPGQI